ncbi:MAG: protein-L-isoaspartate(D-aspartate) O-methyltransferase [Chloroflexi bacterium]|nr:protein-L-isoaspartate(D-aspartate) O-methyltransferase [Chloroflexota bacterium]
MIELIKSRGVTNQAVLNAMQAVPRHVFVPEEERGYAYGDHPLPIGCGQTISQPYIVALMTDLLELRSGDKVLEVGLGSGYQAAVLAEMPGVEVFAIEIIPELAERAQERLASLGYTQIHCKQGDGYFGWPEEAPFNAIVVTAAPEKVPPPLEEQLAIGGRLVVPVGPPGGYQTLWKITRRADGTYHRLRHSGVAFVPFTGAGVGGDEGVH